MSRSGNNEDFRFFNSTEEEPLSQSQRYDIHPMELVVQSLVGGPLDSLSNHLQTLHESQVVLIARLKIMEEKLKKYNDQMTIDIDVKDTNERITNLKKRLVKTQATLREVEQRLERIKIKI